MDTLALHYPFIPKSTAHLQVGDFWAIPLSDGRYGCGYVVALCPNRRKMFVAGLTNWVGPSKPTPPDLLNCRVIEHAKAHIKAITEHGPEILGHCTALLNVDPDDRDHAWGYGVIRVLANKHLREGRLATGYSGPPTTPRPPMSSAE